jgi:hypothetical protein
LEMSSPNFLTLIKLRNVPNDKAIEPYPKTFKKSFLDIGSTVRERLLRIKTNKVI